MANYHWTGAQGNKKWDDGANWVNDTGTAYATGSPPDTGDSVYFDREVSTPSTMSPVDIPSLNQDGVVLDKLVVGPSYNGQLGVQSVPLVIAAREMSVDGSGSEYEFYISSIPAPNLIVRPSGSPLDKDYTTVAAAITAASSGDVIYIYEDAWRETVYAANITVTKNISLYGIGRVTLNGGGAASPIIQTASAVTINLYNLRFTNADNANGAIYSATSGAHFNLTRCIIDNCKTGGGIVATNATFTATDCVIDNCSATAQGGGIWINSPDADITVTRCRIRHCESTTLTSGGIHIVNRTAGNILIQDTIITNCSGFNGGGGIYIRNNRYTTVVGCTITENTTPKNGGGAYVNTCDPVFRNCIIYGNTADGAGNSGDEVYVQDATDAPDFDCCDITGYATHPNVDFGGSTAAVVIGVNMYDEDPQLTDNISPYDDPLLYMDKETTPLSWYVPRMNVQDITAMYTMDDVDNLVDGTGNGNTATAHGAPSNTAGMRGNCIVLDGTADYLTVPNADLLTGNNRVVGITNDNSFSFALWFYAVNDADAYVIYQGNYTGGADTDISHYLWWDNTNQTLTFGVSDTGAAAALNTVTAPNGTFSYATWYHVLCVFDTEVYTAGSASQLRMYVNGKLQGETDSTHTDVWASSEDFYIGARNAAGVADTFFNGRLDDLLYAAKAVTPSEAVLLYRQGEFDPYDLDWNGTQTFINLGDSDYCSAYDIVHRGRRILGAGVGFNDIGAYEISGIRAYEPAGYELTIRDSWPTYLYTRKIGLYQALGGIQHTDGVFTEFRATSGTIDFNVVWPNALTDSPSIAYIEDRLSSSYSIQSFNDTYLELTGGVIVVGLVDLVAGTISNLTEIKTARLGSDTNLIHQPTTLYTYIYSLIMNGGALQWVSGNLRDVWIYSGGILDGSDNSFIKTLDGSVYVERNSKLNLDNGTYSNIKLDDAEIYINNGEVKFTQGTLITVEDA